MKFKEKSSRGGNEIYYKKMLFYNIAPNTTSMITTPGTTPIGTMPIGTTPIGTTPIGTTTPI